MFIALFSYQLSVFYAALKFMFFITSFRWTFITPICSQKIVYSYDNRHLVNERCGQFEIDNVSFIMCIHRTELLAWMRWLSALSVELLNDIQNWFARLFLSISRRSFVALICEVATSIDKQLFR